MARILIADDELRVRLLLQASLPLLGYEVAGVAVNGQEAFELARFLKPDTVLMDIVMPGAMDGIEAAKKIRAELDIPVVFLTGCGDDEIINRAKCADPFGFLIKPCSEAELKAAIEVALHRKSRETRLNEVLSSYREVTETVPHTFWLSSGDYSRILYVSPSYEKMWGRSREALLKNPLDHLAAVHPDELQYVREKIESQKQGEPTEKVFRIVRSDGSLRWLKDSAFPIKDDRGTVSRIVGISEDITEQVRKEQALLRASRLLDAVRKAQTHCILHSEMSLVFAELLQTLVDLTESEYGFVDEVLEDETGSFYKLNLALSNIAWDEDSKQLYADLAARKLEFRDLDNLAGAPVLTGKPVIANDPSLHSGFRGFPVGHPPLRSYLGIPIQFRGKIVGVAGIANRPGGYQEDLVDFLEPFINTCATIIHALRTDRREKESLDRITSMEEKLRSMISAVKETAFLMSVDGTVELINQCGAERLGKRPEEITGKSIHAFIPPETAAHRRVKVEEAVRTGQPVLFEDSREGVQLFHSLYPVKNESGKVERLAVFGVDITERKKSEEALRASEDRYRRIVETAEEGIWLVDREWRTSFVNARMEQMLGCQPGEMLGRHLLEFMGEDGELGARELMARRENGLRESHEFKFFRRDGTELWVLVSANPMLDEAGAFSGGLAMVTDITERKRAEEALRESEKRYRMIFDHSPLGVMHFDCNGIIRDCNNKFAQIIGGSKQEIVGFDLLNRQRDPAMLQAVKDALDGGLGYYEGDYLSVTGGKSTPMRAIYHRITDKDEETVGGVGLFEDVTERKRAEEERERLEARLRQAQKMQAIGTLAGGIAHDFNNVLSAIIGFTELSMGKAKHDSALQADLRQVLVASERAKDLVKQILTFSRQNEQEMKPVLIVPLLKEAMKFIRSSIPSTIAIRQQIKAPSESAVVADPTQLHQIVMNLCTNAAFAMRRQGGRLEVELSEIVMSENDDPTSYPGLNPGPYLSLRVTDTGCGMDEGTIQRIFDPFFTTKPREEGTGMGLAVVYGIVEACGGAITVRSKPGEGSHFHLYFPKAPSPISEPLSDQKAISGGKGRILLVDDEAALVILGEKILQGLGYTVVAETSSRQALAIFRSRPEQFDLLITDYTMPQLTGLDLIEEIRRIRADIPVILCSGFTDFLDRVNIADLGIQELIHKPISRRAIAEAVRRLLPQE